MDINGASAIVTGGASGIGAASARALAAKGVKVVVADMNPEKGEAIAKEIGGVFISVDVTDSEQIKAAIAKAEEIGTFRILVNSAGIGWAQRTIGKDGNYDSAHNLEFFKKVTSVNVFGTFDFIRLGATAISRTEPLADGERGSIVNISSVAGVEGQIGQVSYSASKGAINGMTVPIARDLSAVGIRVNTIMPGLIDTPIYGPEEDSKEFKANLGKNVLFPRRLGTPDELASMVVELTVNSYMNAEVVRVDGGIRMPPK